MTRLLNWFMAMLFVSGFVLCSQDPVTFPWAWLGGLTCFAALGFIANKLLEVECQKKRIESNRLLS